MPVPYTEMTVAAMVLLGTLLQFYAALVDLATARREAVLTWATEADLVEELPRRERRAARRELTSDRGIQIAREIRHVKIVLASWAVLASAAATALLVAIAKLP